MISPIRNVRQFLQPDTADIFATSIGSSLFNRAKTTPFSPPAPLLTPSFSPPPPKINTTPVFQPKPLLNTPGWGCYSPEYLNLQANRPRLEDGIIPSSNLFFNTDAPGTPPGGTPFDYDVTDHGFSVEEAESIATDIADGKSVDQVATQYGVSRQDVVDQLEADGLEVETNTADDRHQQTTSITNAETDHTVATYSAIEQSDGVVVEDFTNADGETTTTVIDENGQRTKLEADQQTTRDGISNIVEDIADEKNIDEIAAARKLSRNQVIAQLEAAGYEYSTGADSEGRTYTQIIAEDNGKLIVSYKTGPSGAAISVLVDTDGDETRRIENTDGSSSETVTEPDGRETTTTKDADGDTVTTVTDKQNGVTVEEVTDDDSQTTTTIIDEDGTRTELTADQEISRQGIDEIVTSVAEGMSIEEVAEQLDLSQKQVRAQLRAAGYVVESRVGTLANGSERYTTKIVSTEDPREVIASHSDGFGTTLETSRAIDSNGTETRTTRYNNGRHNETVTRKDGRETTTSEDADGNTTTSITDNGYMLTTDPDEDMTLRRNDDGTEIALEQGTPEAAVADTLMEINPESDDATEARAAAIVLETIKGMMAGERGKDLQSSIDGKTKERKQAIEDFGEGKKPDNNGTLEDPYGDPPVEAPPSGGIWVQMNGLWMDSAVAKVTLELNELTAEQLKVSAEFQASQAQLDVFILSSDYDSAFDRAQQILDGALTPHGWSWIRPDTPSGNLADNQQRLQGAEAMVEQASGASTKFKNAQTPLDEAITAQGSLPEISDVGICTPGDSLADMQTGTDKLNREQSARDAAEANIDALLYEIGVHNAKGNNLMADYNVGFLEQQLVETKPSSEQYKEREKAHNKAQQQQKESRNQPDIAQAYYDFHAARSGQAQLKSDAYNIRDDLLKAFNEFKGLNEKGKEFRTGGGDYLGKFNGEQVFEQRGGELWVTTHFENGTTEAQLAPDKMSEFWEKRNPEAAVNWLEYLGDRQNAHGREFKAHETLLNTLKQDFGQRQKDVAGDISTFENDRDKLFDKHGRGTTETPEDAFPDGNEPQNIGNKEHPVRVTQEVADTYADKGLRAAMKSSDQPVEVDIDGEMRWVHPDIAMTNIDLTVANARHEDLDGIQQSLSETADRSSLAAEQPAQRMGESDKDFQKRVDYGLLEDSREQALDNLYQPKFQKLADEQGYDNKFTTYNSDEQLEQMLDKSLGLDRSSDDSSDALDNVLKSLHDIGGDNPETNVVPMFLVDAENGVSQINLIAVRGDDGEVLYVDMSGKEFSDLEDFQDNNEILRSSEDGKLVAPRNLEMATKDGNFDLEVVDAYNVSTMDRLADPLVGLGTTIATVLSFTPAAPVAAPLAFLGGGYLGTRALLHQIDHANHGGDWNDLESGLNYLTMATTLFPITSSGLRTFGMAGRTFNGAQVTTGQAMLASIGGVKPKSTIAAAATDYMRSGSTLNRFARGFDWAAISTGVPLMTYSAKSLIEDGSQMSGLQLTDAITGLTTGFAGTGLGARGLVMTRPSKNTGSNILRLHDEGGYDIDARVLGRRPRSIDHVYLQPEIGPRPRGDEAGVADKTHILHRDPQTGVAYVTPWYRGASEPSGRFSDLKTALQERIAQGDNHGSFRLPFRPRKDNEQAAALREELGLPAWVNDTDLQTIAALKQLTPEEIVTLSGGDCQGIESWHLLLLSREQLEAWPAAPESTGKVSWAEWRARARPVLLKKVAEALLEPSAIRPRLASVMENMSPSHTEATAVFRGDTRGPEIILDSGFQPHPTDPQGGISTSLSARKARWWANERALGGDSWVYTVVRDVSDGDIFRALPARPLDRGTPQREADINNHEIRIIDGIAGQDILSARRVDADGNYVGAPVYNPNFKDPARLPDAYPLVQSSRVIGRPPAGVENIYVPPEIGPRPRGDEAGVVDKTHILYRDPETGEAYILPWIRGASENHGPQQASMTDTPPPEVARLYRLDDLDTLNQASQDGTLPPGQFVHIIRSSNPGLENGSQVVNGGTVPRSGRVNDEGHIVWPSTGPGGTVCFTLAQGSRGQQQIHISNTSGDATPRSLNIGNDSHFIVLSNHRVSDFRALVQGGGLPFALYSGSGQWALAPSQEATHQAGETIPTTPVTQHVNKAGETTPETQPTSEVSQRPRVETSETMPVARQAASKPNSTVTNSDISISQDGVVNLHGTAADWSPVRGQSKRRVVPSPYDRNINTSAIPDTVLLPRRVLEMALSPEATARLPEGDNIRVALKPDSQPEQITTISPADNSPSNARRKTAGGFAVGSVLGSLGLAGAASSYGKPSELLQRPPQSDTSSYAEVAPGDAPGMLFNDPAFVGRGVENACKSRFDAKLMRSKEALDSGELTAQQLNWEGSRIIASRRALNLNNEQVAQVAGLTEGLWGRYQLINDLPVTPESRQRGWTDDAKQSAVLDAVSEYRAELKKISGKEILEVNPLEPRTLKGILFNSSILTTHLVNDAVSGHYLLNGGLLDSSYPLTLQIVDKAGLTGFLVANVALAGSAAAKVATGLARVNLKSIPKFEKLTNTSTFIGSYFYGIMTPPWAALTLHSAAGHLADGNWVAGATNLAALPFQIGLSYYGIKGLRDDSHSMRNAWSTNKKPYKGWPNAMTNGIFPIPSTLLAGLTATGSVMQSWHGDPLAGAALAGGTAMQLYFIDLASRRLNWADENVRHGPFHPLSGNRLAADSNRVWTGVGVTLALGMALPGLLNLRAFLEEKDALPQWEWLLAELDDEDEKTSTMESNDSNHEEIMSQPLETLEYIAGHGHRINPDLENHQDYYSVEVKDGQTLGSIIVNQGYRNMAEIVSMNMDHITDPTSLRVGDHIYLPREPA